ncbi:hypothetical protein SAMN02745166_00965 [Prosthecobacter debontii]|uniref:Uncharacterized protein n=1 Tax=Prosthecobacter debontii TaxID=48467 RepID=A0A1T4X332_9BACT|nr:hypothetical protein SAMN02745166_00965 [Prosthecobacter debontii]
MEFNLSFRRLMLLAALLGGFAFLGVFSKPELPQGSPYGTGRVQKAWVYCMLLVTLGAASASVVDHYAGTMEPLNLRPIYILLGVGLMIAGVVWSRSLKQSVEQPLGGVGRPPTQSTNG